MRRIINAMLSALLSLYGVAALGKDVEIEKIVSTYDANQARFHAQYRDKRLSQIGLVNSIKSDVLGIGFRYSVLIDVNGSLVICRTENRDFAASLDKGQRIRFAGKIQDVALGILSINDCEFEAPNLAVERKQKEEAKRKREEIERQKLSKAIRGNQSLMDELKTLDFPLGVIDALINQAPDLVSSVENARMLSVSFTLDLNDDGLDDYVIDSDICGSGGCWWYIVVSQNKRLTVAYTGLLRDLKISEKKRRPPMLEFSAPGVACGLANYQSCLFGLQWDGNRFKEIELR